MINNNILTLNQQSSNQNKFAAELLLQKNDRHEQDYFIDKNALAHIIQNVIIMEKGTYPNQPELGLGIENYLFEFLDKDFLVNLESDIKKQISKFVPHLYTLEVLCDAKKKDKIVSLFIYISIKDSSLNKSGEVKEKEDIVALVLGSNTDTKKFISKLIT